MKLTHYFIVGRNINLLRGCLRNIKTYAGFDELSCSKEILVLIYTNPKIPKETTQELKDYCDTQEHVRWVAHEETGKDFIHNLYDFWHYGYVHARGELIFRAGSDQYFNRGAFPALMNAAEKYDVVKNRIILQSQTIENLSKLKELGFQSRHFCWDLGSAFETFDHEQFEKNIKEINKNVKEDIVDIDSALKYWGRPLPLSTSLGVINRPDGTSWLMSKKDYEMVGPMNINVIGEHTQDVLIHDRLYLSGFRSYIVRDCVNLHFVKGESS